MLTRSRMLVFFVAGMTAILAGCGGSTTNVQNPPAPPSTAVSIAFQPAPVQAISLNSATTLTAVVSDDPNSAGVDWSLLCQSNSNCGSLLPLHTASGSPASYTPPAVISGNSQTFTIEAFATADHNTNIVTSITVTGFAREPQRNLYFPDARKRCQRTVSIGGRHRPRRQWCDHLWRANPQ